MLKIIRKISKKVAQPPGTLTHVGEKKTDDVTVNRIRFDRTDYSEENIDNPNECKPEDDPKKISWINVNGLHDVKVIETIGSNFSLHSLVMEDILNTHQRPKIEDFENHIFIVVKMLSYDREIREIKSEQVSFILYPNTVLSFQEREGDVFNSVRDRMRKKKGRICKMGADYLLYALMDAVIDHYFYILESLGEEIEELENTLVENPLPETLQTIHRLKREILFLRRSIWPLREVISVMLKSESKLIKNKTEIFIKDLYDHTIQVVETTETFRDMVSGLQDLYLSSISNKTNEVMKVLTIIATIFIPLTFIAGIYGMNFEFMPELKWKYAYFCVWGVIGLVCIAMIWYFKRRKWL